MAYDGFALTLRTKVKAARNDTVEGHTSNSAANAHHKAAARLRRREAQAFAASIGERKGARVAIVGAGPTGLWLAVLIARKHASFAKGPNGLVITRRHNAPTVDVFEKREKRRPGADERAHGARSIVLAITQQTSALLNRHLHSPHGFAPISRVGQIESVLLAEFERYAAAGFGRTQFGEEVSDPDELHARGYDVVFVASGRRHASDAWRAARGMESLVDSTSAATVLEFWGSLPHASSCARARMRGVAGFGWSACPSRSPKRSVGACKEAPKTARTLPRRRARCRRCCRRCWRRVLVLETAPYRSQGPRRRSRRSRCSARRSHPRLWPPLLATESH